MDYKDINTYDYPLDESLIAQVPIKERDHSKLLVVNKYDGKYKDEVFYKIKNYFHKGDTLVLNNTKVLESNIWECLVRPQKRVHKGTIIKFDD